MSGDKEQEYFSDGLTEELLNSLAEVNELHVAARTSAFSFKGKDTDIGTIARKLNVETVLEGACGAQEYGAITRSSSMRPRDFTCGRRPMTGTWATCSSFKPRSPPPSPRPIKITLLGDTLAKNRARRDAESRRLRCVSARIEALLGLAEARKTSRLLSTPTRKQSTSIRITLSPTQHGRSRMEVFAEIWATTETAIRANSITHKSMHGRP